MNWFPLLLLAFLAAAQLRAGQPFIRLFTTDDGLVRNWVTNIRNDRAGRLWFTTAEGLSVFDGERFINYTEADGLPDRFVVDCLDSGDGAFWLSTGTGVYRFWPRGASPQHPLEAVFLKVPLQDSSPTPLGGFFQTRSGELWFVSGKGLFRPDKTKENWTLESVPLEVSNPSPAIADIAEDRSGNIWLLTGSRLVRRTPQGALISWNLGLKGTLKTLLAGRDGSLWLGAAGDGGLYQIDIGGSAPRVKLAYGPADASPLIDVQALYEDPQGDLWVGGLGLAQLHLGPSGREWVTFDKQGLLGSLNIGSLAADPLGNLWLAVSNNGAARISPRSFTSFSEADGLRSKGVYSLFETHDGELFAVTGEGHILHQFDGRRFMAIPTPVPPAVKYFGWGESAIALEDRRGEWWIATDQGLLRYPKVALTANLASQTPRLYGVADGLPSASITRIFEDAQGTLWLGTAQGVAAFDPTNNKVTDHTAELRRLTGSRNPLLFSCLDDPHSGIWLGLGKGGPVRFRAGRLEAVPGVTVGIINGMLVDKAGRLWLASAATGLTRLDDPASANPVVSAIYTTREGLSSNQMFALVEDRQGRIYAAGGRGVDRLDPATGFIQHFGASDGLPPGEVQRMYADRSGAIWFASNFGLSRYEPGPADASPGAIPLIHGVRVGGAPVMLSDNGQSAAGRLDLVAGSDVVIAYGSVDFSPARRARYQYRLLPLDTGWRPATSQLSAEFARLGPANYTFEVRTIDGGGRPGTSVARFEFRMPPPVWQRWWFVLLSAAALVGSAHTIYSYRLRQLLAVQQIRTRLATDLHDDLGSGLAEIAILSEVAKQNTGAEQAGVMEAVAARAREMRATMGDIVWSVDPAHDNLTNVIRRWRLTAAGSLGNISLTFAAPPETETDRIPLAPDQRRHLLLLFKEAIANAARHAASAHVAVEVSSGGGRLRVRISDDGCGFSLATVNGGGNGLRNMELRAREMKGSLQIESTPGSGTLVEFDVPV